MNCSVYLDLLARKPSLGRHSLGVRSKQAAIEAVHQLDLVKAVEQGLVDESVLKIDSQQVLDFAAGRKLYEQYVNRPMISGGPKPATTKRYRAVLDKFLQFAERRKLFSWNQVNRQVLDDYASWLDD